ncbi:MAG: SpoVR family protein [Chloroflexi bacterium]|nr:SpoVR family protein [Chloroflexota bacterium]
MNDLETRDLEKAIERIWEIAERLGLDPYPLRFEVIPATIMYEFGAYGLPGRFAHWTNGRAYQQIKTMYDYGLSKIYELVVNTNPSYAFLLEGNTVLQNKLVAAHVVAHCDFFKNNAYFANTNRQMIDAVSINAERIRRYEFQHGHDEVERFLDSVLSIQEHVDPHLSMRRAVDRPESAEDTETARRPRETPYDDLFRLDAPSPSVESPPAARRFPEEPEKDLLHFLAGHAPDLKTWQRDIIMIVRSEMLYFVPQMQTKIMNEGWASYWHARIMRELDLTQQEYVEFAHLHASVLAPSKRSLNPYYVGFKMFEDIERRWDNPSEEERRELGRPGGEGRAKIFEVRSQESDASFIRNYLTRDLVKELDLYIYKLEGDEWKVVEKDWEKIRDMIVASMTNFGNPYIVVEDGDYRRNRELLLRHVYEGQELDIEYAERTLQHVYNLWRRPVHIATRLNDKDILLSFDGQKNERHIA